jgi:putative aminopeptidase FrvX
MDIVGLLQKFCLAPAPSGYEYESAILFKQAIESYTDNVMVDRMGNVVATVSGTNEKAPRIMVFAHMDQLGFIVRRIETEGLIQIDRLGGIPEKVLPGLGLLIRTNNGGFIPAVIGLKAHHVSSMEEKYKVDPVTSLYVDMGASNAEEVRTMGVDIGCPAVFAPRFSMLLGDRACGTAIDNRGGLTAMVVAASLLKKKRPACTVYFVGTVWEEFNIRGAVFAARRIKPDIAFCLDVAIAGDTPDLRIRYENKLGSGPTINLYSFHGRGTLNGTIPHEGLVRFAEQTAKNEDIPHQRFASLGIITDSAYVQMENGGICCLDMGFPTRYTHSPVEVCSISDIKNLGRLVAATAGALDVDFDLYRYRL